MSGREVLNSDSDSGRRPLRLFVVGASWPPETFLGRLMRGLSAAGVNVTVAFGEKPTQEWFWRSGLDYVHTPHWEGLVPIRLLRLGMHIFRALVLAPKQAWVVFRNARQRSGLRSQLRVLNRLLPFAGRKWDLLYFPWNSAAINYLPLVEFGRPAILSCRGSQINVVPHDPRQTIQPGLARSFERITRVHCVSTAIESEAVRLGLDRTKSRVVHPGVDPEFFSPSVDRLEEDSLEIVTVGRLVWVKGLTYALEALRKILDRGVSARFSIVGDGPEIQRIRFTIHDLGMERYVRLMGRLPPLQVRDFLRNADVFVLPSLSEGFCNAAIEAMSCAVPVVLTDCGGAREVVTDAVEGFLVPVRDPTAMAKALEVLASDTSLRRRMGQAGRERVIREFTLARQVREFTALIEETTRCQSA